MERKKIGQIQGRIRGEGWFAIPRYNTSLSTCSPNMTALACTVSQKSLTKNFIIQSMERKKIGQIQARIRGEGWFTIPRYTTSLSTCTPNMTTIACTVSQKSLTKNFIIQSMERKKIGQIQGRIRGKGWFAIPRYTTSLSTCLPNMTLLACTVSQTSMRKISSFKVWKERNLDK